MNRKYSILMSSLLCLPGFQSVQAQDSGSELKKSSLLVHTLKEMQPTHRLRCPL